MPSIISRPRFLVRLIATAAAFVLLAVFGPFAAAPAAAHDALVSTDPPAGTVLDALPAQLTLTFSGELAADPGATELAVTDVEGVSLLDGAPIIEGTVVTQPLASAASGVITVLWKVVSSDGHPISGELAFTVDSAPASTASPTPAPSASQRVQPTPTPDATQVPTEADSSPVPWIVLALLAVAVIAAVAYLLVSRGRRNDAPSTDSPPSAER